jgi:hypothetical protein
MNGRIQAETVYVNFDSKTLTKLLLSTKVRAALAKGVPDKIVDPSNQAASAGAS